MVTYLDFRVLRLNTQPASKIVNCKKSINTWLQPDRRAMNAREI